MPNVFAKLNLKDQREILVVDAPESFEAPLSELSAVAVWRKASELKRIGFAIAFAMTQKQVDTAARAIVKKAIDDAVIWIAYPKGTSKKYTCEFNRDNGWAVLGELGYEPVRQVAIDADWSALRFRRVDHIRSMTRTFAMTEQGKAKAKAAKR